MAATSDKGRWGAAAAPTASLTAARGVGLRDLIAIVAGSIAVAGLGVAVWSGGTDDGGVALRPAAAVHASPADIAATDGGWSGMSLPGFGGSIAPVAAKPVVVVALTARTDDEHIAHTIAFAQAMMPRLRGGVVDGFTIRGGALPAVFAQAGVRAGDIVTRIDGAPLTSNADVSNLSRRLAGARTATFTVERDGRAQDLRTSL